MSNLTQNTTALQELLAKINNLPAETDLTPIITALTKKGQTVPDGATVDMLASLIAAIEAGGGNLIMGTLTVAEANSVITIQDELPNVEQAPLAVFFYETGAKHSDSSHTKKRYLLHFAARSDGGLSVDTKGSYKGASIYLAANDILSNAEKTSYGNAFNASSSAGSSVYNVVCGNLSSNIIYIKTTCLVVGRTYVWGVFPWRE